MCNRSKHSCVTSVFRLTVLLLLVGAHFVSSGDLACSIRAHSCPSAVFKSCSSASLLHVALLVFCMKVLHFWFLCSYVPVALLFALWQCTLWLYAPVEATVSFFVTCNEPSPSRVWLGPSLAACSSLAQPPTAQATPRSSPNTFLQHTIVFTSARNGCGVLGKRLCLGRLGPAWAKPWPKVA
jgi:hypothetical protein